MVAIVRYIRKQREQKSLGFHFQYLVTPPYFGRSHNTIWRSAILYLFKILTLKRKMLKYHISCQTYQFLWFLYFLGEERWVSCQASFGREFTSLNDTWQQWKAIENCLLITAKLFKGADKVISEGGSNRQVMTLCFAVPKCFKEHNFIISCHLYLYHFKDLLIGLSMWWWEQFPCT